MCYTMHNTFLHLRHCVHFELDHDKERANFQYSDVLTLHTPIVQQVRSLVDILWSLLPFYSNKIKKKIVKSFLKINKVLNQFLCHELPVAILKWYITILFLGQCAWIPTDHHIPFWRITSLLFKNPSSNSEKNYF
jgi:hypothetical protein